MNYFVIREENRYGPYTRNDLRSYVRSGNISADDHVVADGSEEKKLVADFLAEDLAQTNFLESHSAEQPAYDSSNGTGVLGVPSYMFPARIPFGTPPAPGMDWWLVLILTLLSCGLFGVVWGFVQANWVRKVNPGSRALLYMTMSIMAVPIVVSAAFGAAMLENMIQSKAISYVVLGIMLVVGIGAYVLNLSAFVSINTSLADATSNWGAARIDLGTPFTVVVIICGLLRIHYLVAPVWIQSQLDQVRRFQNSVFLS